VSDDLPRPRPRKAVGPDRPTYLDAADVDRVMAVLLALVSEVAALRERLDTHERIATGQALATGAAVEAYAPDAVAEAEREAWRDGYLRRLFRVITEDVETLRGGAGAEDVD
jgi:hypothetical protein